MAAPVPNRRSGAIAESVTLAIAARSLALRAEGRDVVSLGAGEPDFPTPEPIARAGIAAIERGDYRYTAAGGTPALRAAAARWLCAAFGLRYEAAEVLVTAGAKPALHMALTAVLEPGDRVLVPAPYWVSYPALVHVAGGETVVVPPSPERAFVPDPAQLDALAAQHGARGLVLNHPNNPSGAVPTRAELQAIVDVARRRDLWILSDEIYAQLRYDGAEHVSPAAVDGGRERTMVVAGFTKSHTLTGWRIGFLAGPSAVIDAAGRIQSQVLGSPPTVSQAAALAACAEPPGEEAARRLPEFDARRRYLVTALNAIDGLRLQPPRGAFYALVDATAWCTRLGVDDVRLCERLLEEQLLAVVPGSAFGAPGFVRLSYAASMDRLRAAVERLRAFGAGVLA
ncbi:MAG: pyridoxal phosphate-dependent aminotransferase [Planctomycetota bacterium]